MKRKRAAKSVPVVAEPIVAPEIMEEAQRSLLRERAAVAKVVPLKCEVCGSDVSTGAAEQLCWVCRRLKISAWRDSEQQATVQE